MIVDPWLWIKRKLRLGNTSRAHAAANELRKTPAQQLLWIWETPPGLASRLHADSKQERTLTLGSLLLALHTSLF